jgi:N-acetylglucosamine-6-sulfatase
MERHRIGAFRSRLPTPILAAIVALALAGAEAHPAALDQAATAQPRPNVIVIESDDQTVEQMRVMQNVNSLIGAKGVTFANSFVNFSLCCPSRATFLTGQYAHNHRVLSNHGRRGGFRRFESLHRHNNLAVWLKRAGYYTGLIGKYFNGYRNRPAVVPAWSQWHAAAPHDQWVYGYTLNDNGTLTRYHNHPTDYKQDVLTRKAVDFVDRRAPQAQPFFLWLAYTAPHVESRPNPNPPKDCRDAAKPAPRDADAFNNARLPKPPNFNEADVSDKPKTIRMLPRLTQRQIGTIRRKYRCELESLLSIDVGVRKIVKALKAKGALDNTLLVYTSDNGYFHGEHRIPRDKQRPYEESIRVPLEMRGPGIPKGVTINPLVINADLAPTIVDAANAHPGLTMDGRSLLPVVRHPAIDKNRELLIEEPGRSPGFRRGPRFEAIRTQRYMYVKYSTGEKELYRLKRDPFELHSLQNYPAYASIKATLATRLRKLKSCAGRSCRVYQSDPSP